ncbi:MAG: ABC transporter substrate-binding protein [Acidimicrobiales bacterium]
MGLIRSVLPATLCLSLMAAACGTDSPDQGAQPSTTASANVDSAASTTTSDTAKTPSTPANTTPHVTTTVAPTTTTFWGVDGGRQLIGPAGMQVNLAHCPADWSDTTGVSADTIVLGQTAPLSGPVAEGLGEVARAFNAYLVQVNNEGGINGRRIHVLTEDDQYRNAQTPAAAAKLREQGVFALPGGIGSGQALAASADANAACVPQLFPLGAHPGLANPVGQPWTVGAYLSFNAEAYLWAEHIAATHPAGATIAVLAIDNDYGRAIENALIAAAQRKNGLRVLDPIRHLESNSDAPARAAEAAAAGADVIVAATVGQGCANLVSAVSNAAGAPGYLTSGCGPMAEGAEGWLQVSGMRAVEELADPAVANHPDVTRYRSAMAAAGIDPASLPAWSSFLSAHLLVETLRAADARPGGLTRTNLLLAARSLRLTHPATPLGVTLHLNGNADGHALEGGAVYRFAAPGAPRHLVTVIDLDGQVPPCPWDLSTLRCAN